MRPAGLATWRRACSNGWPTTPPAGSRTGWLSRRFGHGPRRPDVILIVADATALARALYLTIEILEIGRPVVIALNMTDEARSAGIDVDVERLEALTGARVVPTVANKGVGTAALRAALAEAIARPAIPRRLCTTAGRATSSGFVKARRSTSCSPRRRGNGTCPFSWPP